MTISVINGEWTSSNGPDSGPDSAPVTVSGGETTQANFGYFKSRASLGNLIFYDYNKNGIQDSNEGGIGSGVPPVVLRIQYSNGLEFLQISWYREVIKRIHRKNTNDRAICGWLSLRFYRSCS